MADSTTRVRLGWRCLDELPPGALVLVPAIEPSRRDTFLATAIAFDQYQKCLWICATENPISACTRLQHKYKASHLAMCAKLAEEQLPTVPSVEHPGFGSMDDSNSTRQERADANAAYERYLRETEKHSARVKELAAKAAQKLADDWIQSSNAPSFVPLPADGIAGIETIAASASYVVIVIDDASAVPVAASKAPSSKQTEEIVRRLKAVALRTGARVLVGMPAPLRIQKDRYTGRESECDVELADLASYGNPHEAADVVVEATSDTACNVIFNRYNPASTNAP